MERNGEYYFTRAEEKLRNGDKQGWVDLDQAIRLEPQNLTYYWFRGNWRYDVQEWSLAIEDLTKIIELSSNLNELKDVYTCRAVSYEHLGYYNKLLEDLNWLIDHQFGTATIFRWRGHYKYQAEQFKDALIDFSMAYQLSPTEDYLLKRAQAYYQLGQYHDALQDLTKIISSKDYHPNYLAVIHHWRGSVYYKLENFQEALNDFNLEINLKGGIPFSNLDDYVKMFGLASK